MTPGKFLKWRKRHFKSQREAAEALGVCIETISNYERGRRSGGAPAAVPKVGRLAMAAIELGIDEYHGETL